MKNYCVLLSGPTIASDNDLDIGLQNCALVLKNSDCSCIESIVATTRINLILLELVKDYPAEVEIIKKIKVLRPDLEIVVIVGNANSDVIAWALQYGAKDAFRMPYKTALIVERVAALLHHQEKSERKAP